MTKKGLKATSLRSIFTVLLILITSMSSIGFYFALNAIDEKSMEIKSTSPTLASNETMTDNISELNTFITDNTDLFNKANSIAVDNSDAQDKILTDLNKYAKTSGISITLKFDDTTTSLQTTGAYTSKSVIVTVSSPTNYTNFLDFLTLTENSLPVLQISSLSLNRLNNTEISIDPITIRYYTK